MDFDSDEELELVSEKLDGVFPPLCFDEYGDDAIVPGLAPEERLDPLWHLIGKTYDFALPLATNGELFDRFKHGMSTNLLEVPAPAPALREADRTIEAALINYAEFAALNMKRVMHVMGCEPYVRESTKAKKTILYTPYYTLSEAVELLHQWGTEATLDAFEDQVGWNMLAFDFAESLGINLLED
jgi:hypothetical protein